MQSEEYRDVKNAGAGAGNGCACAGERAAHVAGGPLPSDSATVWSGEIADGMIENGFDAQTHGGGSIESVPGFDAYEPIMQGIGSMRTEALPSGLETMKDAGHVHYDDGSFRDSVCGRDDRVRVETVTAPPWRMIAKLVITAGNGAQYVGTGWFISPRTVMTAGHCLHSDRTGGWARSIEVIPAMDDRRRPFGSAVSRTFHSVSGWIRDQREEQDYGCIILPESARLGDRTGWFGFANLPDAALANLLVNTAGYPADKTVGTQWFNAGRITHVRAERIEYLIDTFGGQSGSAVWRHDAETGQRHVVGIHNYGGCDNKASRIGTELYQRMQDWKALGA
ncbi:MAG: trypsin-like serine peptidase [Paracoccus sp. (in: a-proteobacteria)]